MYPLDLVRALQMANAGSKLTTRELLSNFQSVHGLQGFFTQGLVPEIARSTWMRFIKFSLFPIVHRSIYNVPERLGSPLSKAVSAIVSSVPEAMSIMPLEIAKIALQLDTANIYRNNMFNAMHAYYKARGLTGFTLGYVGIQYRQGGYSMLSGMRTAIAPSYSVTSTVPLHHSCLECWVLRIDQLLREANSVHTPVYRRRQAA